MDDETMAVQSDSVMVDGNGLPPEAPSPEPAPVDPADNQEPAQPAASEPELFELPDGRKVTGEELYREHTENLLPEFTKRSQELADLKRGNNINNTPAPENPYADPNYIPQSYDEIIQAAKVAALNELAEKEQQRIEQQQAIENEVANQLASIKKTDPTLNENALFLHANKYGFRDLGVAYQNMKDMNLLAKNVQQTTARNIAKRNDPVSATPGASGTTPNPSDFATARDYLRSLQK